VWQIGEQHIVQSPRIHESEINHVPPVTNAPPFDPNTGNLDHNFRPPTPDDQEPESFTGEITAGLDAKIEDLRITAEFIEGLRTATLEESNMRKDNIKCLREAPSQYPDEVLDKHFLKALRTFIATTNALEKTYIDVRAASQACYPGDPFLSFDQVKRKLELLTGVVPILHDMCIDTCAAFTGPFSALDTCPK
jgi:hypothetical protein